MTRAGIYGRSVYIYIFSDVGHTQTQWATKGGDKSQMGGDGMREESTREETREIGILNHHREQAIRRRLPIAPRRASVHHHSSVATLAQCRPLAHGAASSLSRLVTFSRAPAPSWAPTRDSSAIGQPGFTDGGSARDERSPKWEWDNNAPPNPRRPWPISILDARPPFSPLAPLRSHAPKTRTPTGQDRTGNAIHRAVPNQPAPSSTAGNERGRGRGRFLVLSADQTWHEVRDPFLLPSLPHSMPCAPFLSSLMFPSALGSFALAAPMAAAQRLVPLRHPRYPSTQMLPGGLVTHPTRPQTTDRRRLPITAGRPVPLHPLPFRPGEAVRGDKTRPDGGMFRQVPKGWSILGRAL